MVIVGSKVAIFSMSLSQNYIPVHVLIASQLKNGSFQVGRAKVNFVKQAI